jgi:hypothetical protein
MTEEKDYVSIEWLWYNFPGFKYVVDTLTNYIFSNRLIGANDEESIKLDNFLSSTNIQGVSNFSVIRDAVRYSLVYGQGGIRWLSNKDGIVFVPFDKNAVLTSENMDYKALTDIEGYLISRNDQYKFDIEDKNNFEINLDKDNLTLDEFKNQIVSKDDQFIILPVDRFVNLRMDTTKPKGEPPMWHDRQRVQLLSTVYDRLIHDLNYDGPGRLALFLRDGLISENSGMNAGELFAQTNKAKKEYQARVRNDTTKFADAFAKSNSRSTIVVPNVVDKLTPLPNQIKSVDYIDISQQLLETVANNYSSNPAVLGIGKMSGNVSMAGQLSVFMHNTIIPQRELFARQINAILSEKIGISKITFDKYEETDTGIDAENKSKVLANYNTLLEAGKEDLAEAYLAKRFMI